jgi:hypothetical protein
VASCSFTEIAEKKAMSPLSIRPEIPKVLRKPTHQVFDLAAIGELLDPIEIGDLDEGAVPMWKLAIVEAQMIIDDHRRGAVSSDAAIRDLRVVVRRLLSAAKLEDCDQLARRS